LNFRLLSSIIATGYSQAWGPDGQHTASAIAVRMITGTHAAAEVKKILADFSLHDTSVSAYCAKGTDPKKLHRPERGQVP